MNRSLEASKQLPLFRRSLCELVELCSKITNPASVKDNDDFGFMTLCFFGRQRENAEAILTLTEAAQYGAAGLVARSMVEGLVQIGWAANDKKVRAWRWRNFAWVADWREVKKKLEDGKKVPAAKQTKIESSLRSFGQTFYTEEAKKRDRNGKKMPPDPYSNNWTGKNYSEIFKAVGANDLRKAVWSPLSAYHHWDPRAIGQSIKRDGSDVIFLPPSPQAGVQALTLGFLCLFQTTEILDEHFALGISPELKRLKKKHLRTVNQ